MGITLLSYLLLAIITGEKCTDSKSMGFTCCSSYRSWCPVLSNLGVLSCFLTRTNEELSYLCSIQNSRSSRRASRQCCRHDLVAFSVHVVSLRISVSNLIDALRLTRSREQHALTCLLVHLLHVRGFANCHVVCVSSLEPRGSAYRRTCSSTSFSLPNFTLERIWTRATRSARAF